MWSDYIPNMNMNMTERNHRPPSPLQSVGDLPLRVEVGTAWVTILTYPGDAVGDSDLTESPCSDPKDS